MKRFYLLFIAISIIATIYGQAPAGFNYQAVARNAQGQLITNTQVILQIAIIKGSMDGTSVYTETFSPTTNNFGLVNLSIGNGTVVTGTFSDIDWGTDTYFIKVLLNDTEMGTSQLLSVPYALYAKTAENGFTGDYNDLLNKPIGLTAGDILYWNGTAWVILPIGQPGQFLQVANSNLPIWSGTTSTLSTLSASSITGTHVSTGGNITNDGGLLVTERGVCWNTSPNPKIANNKTSDGTGKGSFVSSISGLVEGTTYYIRAFAINSLGTAYGNEVSFTTFSFPVLTTTSISSKTSTTASTGGNITSDGGSVILARGVCWNISGNPSIEDNKTSNSSGKGVFSSSVTGLSIGTKYYLKAYATNSIGTSYGDEINFTTLSLPVLTTLEVSAISGTEAICTSNISSDGGSVITSRGVCWGLTANPTITSTKTIDGNDTGTIITAISGLIVNTKYYIRSYAINSLGTAYGNELTFTTPSSIPTLTTKFASTLGTEAVGPTATVVSGGNISFDGGAAIIARGVCWSFSTNPTIDDNHNTVGTGMGYFPSSISGLILDTIYYLRAYASNAAGTAYGNEISFTTLAIGQSYQGGKLAYILQPNDPGYDANITHGLILGDGAGGKWYSGSFTQTGATSTLLGTGNANTNTIVSSQGEGNYAAINCYNLEYGGYSDWYLPSIDELKLLYYYRNAIGDYYFFNTRYWSSSEDGTNNAYAWSFTTGTLLNPSKDNILSAYAVRSF